MLNSDDYKKMVEHLVEHLSYRRVTEEDWIRLTTEAKPQSYSQFTYENDKDFLLVTVQRFKKK